jgi:two-component system, OmpR family, sensor kinase
MSIRLRLTLLFSAILALTLIVSSAILYVSVSRLTFNVRQDALVEQAELITSSSSGFALDQVLLPAGGITTPRTFIQTLTPSGEIVYTSENLEEFPLPLSREGYNSVLLGHSWTEAAETDEGRILIYSQRVNSDQGTFIGIIQVARSIADHDSSMETLRNALVVGTSVATLIAFGIGWIMAGTALKPINRITETAQEIGDERDFSQRVEYDGPPDELGRLTTTMNVMLTELQAAFSHAERTLDAQRRFAADASHELRTPLTTIRGNLELLRRDPPIDEADRKEVINDVVEECERLSRLVNDLMLLQRADAEWPVSSDRVRIKPVLEEICRQARRIDQHRTITCSNIADISIAGNRDALKQIVLILLDNAIKYSTPGTPVVVSTSADSQRVRITVSDSGPGIDPDRLPYIFERFYRGDEARRGNGVGLGLAIAKALVEAQRGRIDVNTTSGEGTTFTITLPRASTLLRGQRELHAASADGE